MARRRSAWTWSFVAGQGRSGLGTGEGHDGVAVGSVGLLSCWIRNVIRMPMIAMMTLVTPINTSKACKEM